MITPLAVLASLATGAGVILFIALVSPPRRRLAARVRPYAVAPMASLGLAIDARSVQHASGEVVSTQGGLAGLAERLIAALLVRGAADTALQRRLQQAACYDSDPSRMVVEHRTRQVLLGLATAGAAGGLGWAAGLSGAMTLGLIVLGLVAGVARPNGAVDRALAARQQRIRAELPAVAQLLALRMRAGGSVVTALGATAQRCTGEVATNLTDALAQHRAGRPLDDVLDEVAGMTPEPEAARLYRLLSGTIRYGLDAAPELLRVAREGRTSHLTRLKRDATRRRGALLLPTIGLLAPQMLLFIAAPLPALLRGAT